MPDLANDMIIKDGLGLVNPDQAGDFYEAMHSYLVDVGITGVNVLEFVSEHQGGGVKLAKAHYDGLNQSPNKNFEWSGLIASMEQFNGFFFLGTRTYFHG
ncbi:hypothetical protein Peur_017893 [Populus x canadensis]